MAGKLAQMCLLCWPKELATRNGAENLDDKKLKVVIATGTKIL